jgi:hypothetical protein
MSIQSTIGAWLAGVPELTGYNDVPGYRELAWWQRKTLDQLVIWRGIGSAGFWRAMSVVVALDLVTLIICWRWDLTGWHRDILRCCPPLIALPWLAAARKRHLRALLRVRHASPQRE